jgi:radical SAM superfamily enzyme YgiQ (UPF0313 family)
VKVVLIAGTPAEHAVGAPGASGRDFAFSSYNYAIGLLKACALNDAAASQNVDIALRDLPVARMHDALSTAQLDNILSEQPHVVGLSCYCWSVDLLLDAAATLKQARPGLIVLAGGPSVSFDARAALERAPELDIVVRGEGEAAFVELCRRRFERPWEVPNVVSRDPLGMIREHPEERIAEDLNALPSPYLTGVLAPQTPTLLLEPSRGCRFRCSFCAWSTRQGGIRHASMDKLAQEVRWARAHGYLGLNFCDTAINHDTSTLRALCELLQREDPNRSLSLSVFVRHEQLDQEQIELLASIRCDEIILGIESTNPVALKGCGKAPWAREPFEQRLLALQRPGHRVTLSIMSGLPGDSVQGFRTTLDTLEDLIARMPECINFVCCFWLAVLPGTRFAAMAADHQFQTLKRGTPYLIESRDWSSQDLIQAARILVDRVAHNPRLRCEEIHRAVATSGKIDSAGAPGPRGSLRSQPSRPIQPVDAAEPFTRLLSPWTVGQRRGGWIWEQIEVAAAPEGSVSFRFRPVQGVDAVRVTLSDLDPGRPCFARTQRYNVYYCCDHDAAVPQKSAATLASVVAGLIARNEREDA